VSATELMIAIDREIAAAMAALEAAKKLLDGMAQS
jgi:hypothetical protein